MSEMLQEIESDISLESKTIYHSNFHYSKKKRAREKGGEKKKKDITSLNYTPLS